MALMNSFIFDGNASSPEQLARQRAIAAQIMGQMGNRPARNVGEGIGNAFASIGQGITANVMNRRANRAETEGRAGADELFGKIVSGISGGGVMPSAPASSPAAPQMDPASQRVAQAHSNSAAPGQFSGSQQEFVDMLMPAAIEASQRTGIDPRIIVAQAAQETGWGRSAPGNNFFGIKSHGKGGGQNLKTHEYINGQRVNVSDSFRTFGSPDESVAGYADFILQNPRYRPLMQAQGLDAQLEALQASGYATDPNYSRSVGSIARGIQLPQQAAPDANPGAAVASSLTGSPVAPELPMAGGTSGLAPTQQPQAPQPTQVAQAGGLDLQTLMQAASNPFLNEGQRAVVNSLIQQQMQQQDPMRQLQMQAAQQGLERGELEIEQLRNPQPKTTAEMQNLAWRAEQAGLQPGTPEYSQFMMTGGDKGTNITVNTGEGDKFYENLDKKNAETFSALSEAGVTGRAKMAQVERLGELLRRAPQGASAMLKQAAGEYGINTEGLSDIQAAQALINELVPQQRQPGSGPMSDADLALFKQSLPRLINQPEGNQLILDTMRNITRYQIQMGDIADLVADREISPAEGRKMIRELANPLEGFGERAGEFAGQRGSSSRQEIDGYIIEQVD